MIKLMWDFSSKFFEKDSREKLIIIFVFVLALCILFRLGKEGMELLGVIVGGFFTFLKGTPSKKEDIVDTDYLLKLTKEKEDLNRTLIIDGEKKEQEKPKVTTGDTP
jgi:c-di-AMP phosphodiesterase-like protein